eukprot:TRINITY_DN4945_c0_g2_i15.p1 TRINITY_DN4945_c0_g2~~TRINITY_DN4945_c0_g2_i15.p1  ORF type:complete len:387 (+),score=73.42 TRINITY_DN4945_c0_g2_i15:166-1326(+)
MSNLNFTLQLVKQFVPVDLESELTVTSLIDLASKSTELVTEPLRTKIDSHVNYVVNELSVALLSLEKSKVLPSLHKLNKQLELVVYVVENIFSFSDLVLFAFLAPTLKTWNEEFYTFNNISRWYDLIQHHPKLCQVVKDNDFFVSFRTNLPKPQTEGKGQDGKAQTQNEKGKQKGQQKGQPRKEAEKNPSATKEQQKAQPGKAQQQPAGGKKGGAAEKPDDIYRCDLRVGKIIDVIRHPEADTLYKETIDFGEEAPRTVVSGLVKYIPIEEMRDKFVICLCNLKPANMRGIRSEAMVLVASHLTDESKKELIEPVSGSLPGDKIFFEGHVGEPDGQINLSSKGNIFSKIQIDLKTNDDCIVCWKGIPMVTGKGEVRAKTVIGGTIG